MNQKCLSDLIEIDIGTILTLTIDSYKMRKIPLEEKIPIHSAVLLYDQ